MSPSLLDQTGTFPACVVGLHFCPIEEAVAILVRLTHDSIRNAMLAAINYCFFFGHNDIGFASRFLKSARREGSPFTASKLLLHQLDLARPAMSW